MSVLPTVATVVRTEPRKMSPMPQIAKLTIKMPNRTATTALPIRLRPILLRPCSMSDLDGGRQARCLRGSPIKQERAREKAQRRRAPRRPHALRHHDGFARATAKLKERMTHERRSAAPAGGGELEDARAEKLRAGPARGRRGLRARPEGQGRSADLPARDADPRLRAPSPRTGRRHRRAGCPCRAP